MIGGGEAALLVLLGSLAYLDQWPAVQTMASRPIVVGALAGLVLGAPAEGALWGAVFEAVYLGVLPVGAARYPDAGLAGLTGTTVAIVGQAGGVVPAGYAVAAATAAGVLGYGASRVHRRWNARTAARVRDRVTAGDPSALGRGVAAALARGAGIGAGTAAAALALGLTGLGVVAATPWSAPLPIEDVRNAAAAAAAATGLHLFGRLGARAAVCCGGVGAGALLAWWAGAS